MRFLKPAQGAVLFACLFFTSSERQGAVFGQAASPSTVASSCPVFSSIPDAILPRCTSLVITDGTLGELSSSRFAHLNVSSVTALNISNNVIQDIQSAALWNFTSVAQLDASSNLIVHINNYSFTKLIGITELYLHGNRIEAISQGAFNGLKALVTLRLEDNQLINIGTFFQQIPGLEQLHLQRNMIKHISSDAFSDLPYLRILRLDENELTSVVNLLPNFPALEVLNLTHNYIANMPTDAFQQNSEMRDLQMGYNQLTEIPSAFADSSLRELQILNLRSNNINSSVRAGQLPLRYLHELYLSNNLIPSIESAAFKDLVKIEIIHLDYNRLTSFETWQTSLPQGLQQIRLSHNLWNCNCTELDAWQNLQIRTSRGDLMLAGPNETRCLTPDSHQQSIILDVLTSCKMSPLLPLTIGVTAGSAFLLVCTILACCTRPCKRKCVRSPEVTNKDHGEQDLPSPSSQCPLPEHEYHTGQINEQPNGNTGNIEDQNRAAIQRQNAPQRSVHIYDYAAEGNITRDPSYVNGILERIKLGRSRPVSPQSEKYTRDEHANLYLVPINLMNK